MSEPKNAQTFLRFDVIQRVEHLLLLLSFSLLAITGLPQRFPDNALSQGIIRLFGGIEFTRVVHHASAIVLIILSIFHLLNLGYKLYVQRKRPTILPAWKDVQDFVQAVAYNIGLSKEKPSMGHFNFGEKIEYWAVVWGTVIMAITGYVLWNPVVVTRYLPGEFVPAAKMAHGMEAILAVLSILTWHLYNVHLKYFNRSIFTGKISYHEMEEEHGAVLEEIQAGDERPTPSPEKQWQRSRIYLPVAGILAALFLLATYRFFTIEDTAITTVPPQVYAEVYVPAQPIGLATATPVATAADSQIPTQRPLPVADPPVIVAHPVDEARADCLACHAAFSVIAPAPTDHSDYANETCQECHQVVEEVAIHE